MNHPKKNVAIVFGASGSIGSNICYQLQNKNYKVYGFSRNNNATYDMLNEHYLKNIANTFIKKNMKIKLFINAIGFLHDKEYSPEKKIQDINFEYMKKSFHVNTIPTALMIKYFAPLMTKDEKSIFAAISAKVGSISDNFLGGWYSYRASKAALNQIIKTASIEQKRINKKLIIVSIHPGTVSTKLSKPFIGKKEVQTPQESAKNIINLLENLTTQDSGLLLDYKNDIIPF